MNTTAFGVSSVTYAMRGRALLEQHGITARVHRETKTADNGCGWSIIVPGKSDTAERLLRSNGITIRRVTRSDAP